MSIGNERTERSLSGERAKPIISKVSQPRYKRGASFRITERDPFLKFNMESLHSHILK